MIDDRNPVIRDGRPAQYFTDERD